MMIRAVEENVQTNLTGKSIALCRFQYSTSAYVYGTQEEPRRN